MKMMQTMIDAGLDVEAQHHEVATVGNANWICAINVIAHGRLDVHVQVHR